MKKIFAIMCMFIAIANADENLLRKYAHADLYSTKYSSEILFKNIDATIKPKLMSKYGKPTSIKLDKRLDHAVIAFDNYYTLILHYTDEYAHKCYYIVEDANDVRIIYVHDWDKSNLCEAIHDTIHDLYAELTSQW